MELHADVVDLIDRLAPEHGRTSCSDQTPNNAFYIEDSGSNIVHGKCRRCSLLKMATDKTINNDKKIDEIIFYL